MADLLTILLVLMLITAIAAIHMPSLLSCVISLGALGFGASIAFLLLGAPDVAIPKVVVDVITLVILIRATVGRDMHTALEVRETFGISFSLVLLALFTVFGIVVSQHMPPFGEAGMMANADAPGHFYLAEGLRSSGSPNSIAAVLLDFRGYDTLGEATVLFTALMGAVVLLRKKARTTEKAAEGPQ
jgi:multicomponent Na+:H+ antiporter subunit B